MDGDDLRKLPLSMRKANLGPRCPSGWASARPATSYPQCPARPAAPLAKPYRDRQELSCRRFDDLKAGVADRPGFRHGMRGRYLAQATGTVRSSHSPSLQFLWDMRAAILGPIVVLS